MKAFGGRSSASFLKYAKNLSLLGIGSKKLTGLARMEKRTVTSIFPRIFGYNGGRFCLEILTTKGGSNE
jgi:hypothetical protein